MASRRIRRSLAAAAAVITTMLAPPLLPSVAAAAVPAATPVPALSGVAAGSGAGTAAAVRRHETPYVTPRRTVLREGQPMVFTGRAEPGSTVRVGAVLGGGWVPLTPAIPVRRSGVVRLSAWLPREGRYLVRADVVSRDRSTRYGFGPYVVTVVPRGTRLPAYTTYSLTQLLRSPRVSSAATTPAPIQVGGRWFAAEAAVPSAASPQWHAAITAEALGCIGLNLEVATPDNGGSGSVSVRVDNPWAGRGAHGSATPGTIGRVSTLLDGGPFTIATSGGATVHLRGTLTCPKGALEG